MPRNFITTKFAVGVAVLFVLASAAFAQDWPTHAITLDRAVRGRRRRRSERPHPGTAHERSARPADRHREYRRGGRHGRQRCASPRARPTATRSLIGNSGTQAFNQSLYKKPLYNSVTDFTPVGLATGIAAHPDRAQGPAGQQPAGVRRLRQSATKPRCSSARPASAPAPICRACCSTSRWASPSPSALSRRGAGAAGFDRRPHRLHVLHHPDRRRAGRARQVKGIAVMAPHRVKIIPDLRDHRRAGLAGSRSQRLERILPAARERPTRSCASSTRR